MSVSPEIESLVAYVPGKPIEETKRELGLDRVIKLASNENPLGISPKAAAAVQGAIADLGRYPDPGCYQLKQQIAQTWGVSTDQILVGNGSNELIDLVIRVFCEPGDRILIPDKSFIAYSVCSQAARVGKRVFPIDSDMQLDVDALIRYVEEDKESRDKVLFLANPNNPTGTYLNREKMDRLMATLGGRDDLIVVLDEAYDEFVRADDFPQSLPYLEKYPNVMISKTFSKVFGLAGLRVGALIGHHDQLKWVERVRNPFNVNTLAQAGATAALQDREYIKSSQELVWRGLDLFYEFFESQNLPYWKSQANFVLFDSLRDGGQLFQALMAKGLLLRPLKGYQLPTHLRLSVGTDEENALALQIMAEVLPNVSPIK